MIVSPSILSADFGRLDQDIEMLNRSDAQLIHCDVMDGVFVPNISFGFPVIEAVARKATKELDVHLMIVNPQNYISQVRDCGAAIMNVHQEACVHLHRTVQAIKDAGMKAAVTLNPATPVETLTDIITELDMVLLMSVNPGFGGQKFIANTVYRPLAGHRGAAGRHRGGPQVHEDLQTDEDVQRPGAQPGTLWQKITRIRRGICW